MYTIVLLVLLYGAECWTVKKKEEQILEKTDMQMLRRIKGLTLRDKVKNILEIKNLGHCPHLVGKAKEKYVYSRLALSIANCPIGETVCYLAKIN